MFIKLLVSGTIFCFPLFWRRFFFVCFFSCSFYCSRCTLFITFIITIEFGFLPWNCTFPLADPAWAALFPFPFPLNLWPFDFHLLRDSCWSSIVFFSASFSTSPSSTSQVTSLFLSCRLPLLASFALSSASLAFSLNRIIPYTKDRKQKPGNSTEHRTSGRKLLKNLQSLISSSYSQHNLKNISQTSCSVTTVIKQLLSSLVSS